MDENKGVAAGMKTISIFGSTGTVGRKICEVVSNNICRFEVLCITCDKNVDLAIKQAEILKPKYVVVTNNDSYKIAKDRLSNVLPADELMDMASVDVDVMAMAISGNAGIRPSFACLGHAKRLAIANKEAIVSGGSFFMDMAFGRNTEIIPIDSEHNAIYQCLQGENVADVREIIITCSGGPFANYSYEDLTNVTVTQALKHPKWNMGRKITIDSATLINKAIEIIEAAVLFEIDISKVKSIIHKQSIIHGMVIFSDSSVKALMSSPDMMIPINHAINCVPRCALDIPFKFENLSFCEFKDWQRRNIDFGYTVLKERKTISFNIINEIAVDLFLSGRINFAEIPVFIEDNLEKFGAENITSVEDVMSIIEEVGQKVVVSSPTSVLQ